MRFVLPGTLAIGLTALIVTGTSTVQAGSVCDQDCRPVMERVSGPGGRECYYVSATFDAGTKEQAVKLSRQALKETIENWRFGNNPDSGWRAERVRIVAATARPNPYLRSGVTSDLMLKPDVRTRDAHTTCWRGVVSPAVCTSAARMCK